LTRYRGERFLDPSDSLHPELTHNFSVVALLSVVAYISQTFQHSTPDEISTSIIERYSQSIIHYSLGDTIKVLSVLSSSMSTSTPLPPEMKVTKVGAADLYNTPDLPVLIDAGVEALNVIEITTNQIAECMERILLEIKGLVGEILFSSERRGER